MQYFGHTYNNKLFIYQNSKFNWASYILSGNPTEESLDFFKKCIIFPYGLFVNQANDKGPQGVGFVNESWQFAKSLKAFLVT